MQFLDLKYLLLAEFSLTENHPAQKPLAKRGVAPALNRKKSAK